MTTAPATHAPLRAPAAALLGVLAMAAAVGLALGRLPLNLYDVSFSLNWGRDLVHGVIPDVRVVGAATPHPASIAVGGFAALLGSSALDAIRIALLLSAGCAALALYRIGWAVSSRAAGVGSVLVLAISEPFISATVGQATASDLPSLAALLGALAFALARPRRPLVPLALLALAGLWRPEPWLASAVYALYSARGLDRRRRLQLALVAVSAPAIWLTGDLIMSGDPLYSLTYTHDSTQAGHRPTGLAQAPGIFKDTLTSYLGTPALVGALLGVAIDLRRGRLRRLRGVLTLSVLAFLAIGAAGLALNARYALPTVALLAVYFGYFATAWRGVARRSLRYAWMAAAAVTAVLVVVHAPEEVRALASDHRSYSAETRAISDLGRLTRPAAVRRALEACAPIGAPYRVVPMLAYDLGRRPRTIAVNDEGLPANGSLVVPADKWAAAFFETHAVDRQDLASAGYGLVAGNHSWRIWSTCRA